MSFGKYENKQLMFFRKCKQTVIFHKCKETAVILWKIVNKQQCKQVAVIFQFAYLPAVVVVLLDSRRPKPSASAPPMMKMSRVPHNKSFLLLDLEKHIISISISTYDLWPTSYILWAAARVWHHLIWPFLVKFRNSKYQHL